MSDEVYMVDECCCLDDYNQPEVYDAKMVIARKAHVCCECNETIKPGDRYENVRGLWDKHWGTYNTCARCVRIRKDFFPCGFVHCGLGEDLRECYGVELK